jgi:hypothetical protein
VVVFHYHRANVPGGSPGVDVFFVISGLLITSLLLRDLAQQRTSAEAFLDTLDLVLDCYAGPNVTRSLGSHTVTPVESSIGLELQRYVFTWP